MEPRFDRASEDVGNIIKLEHVNLRAPDQIQATAFYVTGLGLTRDPFIATGTGLMWINIGQNQIHLPTGSPDLLRGTIGLVLPDRDALLNRLAEIGKSLSGTHFGFREDDACVEVTCPWGNRFRCHAPAADKFGPIVLGMPYVEFDVQPGTTAAIARFYRDVFDSSAKVVDDDRGRCARVMAGARQELVYRETAEPEAPYDHHHLQIYLADFSGPYRRLLDLGLISADTLEHEYRFQDIVDLDDGRVVFTVEHEVRSIRHPLYGRPLVNRNPSQTNRAYVPGQDAMAWSMA